LRIGAWQTEQVPANFDLISAGGNLDTLISPPRARASQNWSGMIASPLSLLQAADLLAQIHFAGAPATFTIDGQALI
jgi:hypothetical protein